MRKRRFFAVLLATTAALGATAFGRESGEPPKGEDFTPRIRRLTEEIQILFLLNQLRLTRDQMDRLLPVTKEAKECRLQYQKAREECRIEMEKTFKALKEEDEADLGLSKKVSRSASKANNRYKDVGASFTLRMLALAVKAKEVLTPRQKEIVLEYRPPILDSGKIKSPPRSRKAGKKKKPSKEEKLIREVRSSPQEGFSRIESELVRLQIEREEGKRGEPYPPNLRKRRTSEIRLIFQKARTLPGKEFEENLPGFRKDLKPRTRLEKLTEALKGLKSGDSPRLGPVAKYLLSSLTAEILEKRTEK